MGTFQQRFLVNDLWWQPGAPILFYAGNEGPIESFANATGFQWVLGRENHALVVFAEHRFYGQSATAPGACGSPAQSRFRFLSALGALSDFATLVDHIRKAWGGGESAVIAIGGSYGGMLAAWLRMQYPYLIDAALASSAPLRLGDEWPKSGLYDVVSQNYLCAPRIGEAFAEVLRYTLSTSGLADLSSAFNLCQPLQSAMAPAFLGLLQQAFMTMAQLNYPYPCDFMGASLPANPASVSCQRFEQKQRMGLLAALAAAVSVVPHLDPAKSCLNLTHLAPSFEATLPGLIPGAWSYQRCSQMIIPYAAMPTAGLFLPCESFSLNCWDAKRFANWCVQTYRTVPQPRSAMLAFGGREAVAQNVSRIVFTNGRLDPWSVGGIRSSDIPVQAEDVVSIEMRGAAHHLDLREPNAADPDDVKAARQLQRRFVRRWAALRKPRSAAASFTSIDQRLLWA